MHGVSELLRTAAILALIACNAFFVIGEFAVVTARRAALAGRAEAGSTGARAALRLMDDPVRVISTTQVGITAIGILTGALAEPTVRDILGEASRVGDVRDRVLDRHLPLRRARRARAEGADAGPGGGARRARRAPDRDHLRRR